MDYRMFNDLGGLTVRYMQIFLVAAESGNFSSTAECLNTTQPLISRTIALLESELQVKLFHRSKKNMELTDAGKLLYTHWKTVLNMLRVSVDEARFAEQKLERAFVIADEIGNGKSRYFYPFLYAFRDLYPDVKISVELLDVGEMTERIMSGTVDLAFTLTTNKNRLGNDFECRELLSEPLFAWIHESNPLSKRERLRMSDLADEPIAIVEYTAGSGYYDLIQRMYTENGIVPKITQVCPNPHSFGFLRRTSNITTIANNFGEESGRTDIRMVPIEGYMSGIIAFWKKDSRSRNLERGLEVLDMCIEENLFH